MEPDFFQCEAVDVTVDHLTKVRGLFQRFEPGNDAQFITFLKLCPSVEVSHRQLADLADKSPVTIKRWLDGSKAGKYTQRGLVADVVELLNARLSNLTEAA
ncbi:hypothetical protein [Aliiroseovarius sp. 2305UL8-7]|uniref:hypothetical protein n=1 Tax=Aliiroseovarius conchicola TaxID=3121637 RepID=UPI0035280131